MRNAHLHRQTLRAGAIAAAVFALTAATARATIRIQGEAQALGYPAQNCSYCHVFDSDHMKERGAGPNGVRVTHLDCYACHRDRLPKRGVHLLNERGLYLSWAKRQFRADKVEAAWLKNYREPASSAKAKPKPKPSSQP
jgi:hypothetical protein